MNYKGVIIAAGYGSRFLPATKTIPKEMLPVIDIPALDFIIQEFIQAGIRDIIIINHRKKKALEDYFDRDPELEAFFTKENKMDSLEKIKPYDVNVSFVRQKEMKGTGDALLQVENFLGKDPFVVAYPDDLVFHSLGLTSQMITVYEKYQKSVLSAMTIDGDVSRYGVIAPKNKLDSRTSLVAGMVEKPAPGTEPSKMISIGRYLFTSEIFAKLRERLKNHKQGEFFLTDGIEEMIKDEKVTAYEFEGKRLDTGKPEGFFETVLEYSLSRPELKKILLEFIKTKSLK